MTDLDLDALDKTARIWLAERRSMPIDPATVLALVARARRADHLNLWVNKLQAENAELRRKLAP